MYLGEFQVCDMSDTSSGEPVNPHLWICVTGEVGEIFSLCGD
jgi:hypothetical protein